MRKLSAVAVMLFALHGLAHAADPTPSGEIVLLKGSATATQGGQTVRLYRGASVIVGDRLLTGKGARLQLRMIDGTVVTLGENTEFIVREYEVTETNGVGLLELTRGFFRAVTGKITKLQTHSFQVKTPLAVVGVRGTDFWGEQSPKRLRIALLGGTAVIITNDAGSVELTEAGFGTEVTSATIAPKAPFRWSPEELTRAAGTVN
jgi:hypothetical protein